MIVSQFIAAGASWWQTAVRLLALPDTTHRGLQPDGSACH